MFERTALAGEAGRAMEEPMADEPDLRKKLSLREKKRFAGRLGGLATARKSEEFLAARGAKGGLTTRMIHGSAFYGHISRLRWARRDGGRQT